MIINYNITNHLDIEELAKENGISKTRLCKELNIQYENFNKYYNDEFQRIYANLIIKLCEYFECGISDLLEIHSSNSNDMTPEKSR